VHAPKLHFFDWELPSFEAMVEHQNGRFVPRRPEAAAKDNDLQHAAGAPDVAGDGDHPVP